MNLNHWPINERPREKLIERGAESLSDSELLAIFLRTGVKGKTAVDLSRELIQHFGGLYHVLNTDLDTFCTINGLGPTKFAQMKACAEMVKRYLGDEMREQNVLKHPEQTKRYVKSQLRHCPHEVFACLFLNSQHNVIQFEKLFHGTINRAVVYPRVIVKRALELNAAAVILAHNHPSGDPSPSASDEDLTHKLMRALALIDVHVLDHIVIGDGAPYSFQEHSKL